MKISIHRFHDKIGFSLIGTKGETVYFTAKEAKAIAKALNAGARNIKDCPKFSDSSFSTNTIEFSGKPHE